DYVPQQVYAMRVNKGTRGEITLKSGASDILTVKSKDYGVHTNQIKIWVKEGTAPNSKKILVNYKGNEVSQDNIVRRSMSVRYTGTGTAATMTVTATGIQIAVTGGDPGDSQNITWEECDTLEALVARLNDTGNFVASLIDERPNIKTTNLDTTQAMSIMADGAVFHSNLWAFGEALASMQYIGEVQIVSTNLFVVPDDTSSYVYLSGAAAGTYTIADWTDSLEILEGQDVQSITTPSTDHDVRILISNHITSMCQTEKRKERQGICGLERGVNLETAVAAAKELNSEYMSLVMDDAVANNPLTGATEVIDPAILACKIAGMEAAMGMATPLTNKQLKVNAFGKKKRASELNTMIQNGIMPCDVNEDGLLVIIRAMTAYQDDNLALNERSCVREALYMDRDLRKAYSRRTGTSEEPSRDDIVAILLRKAEQWYTQGLITISDSGELVFNIKVRFDGDKTYLEYSKYLRAPNNFTFITSNNMIYSSAGAA
ncbi:MAG: phage tail sheath subtilisin-like domain-containing protein, partial [Treponema sp.]|nr:phage tail sheath subtilisin-like domain-containing protein [Treponema sp.]